MNEVGPYDFTLLLRLLAAHLIADFILQTDTIVQKRFKYRWASGWLYFHGIVAGLLIYCLAGIWGAVWLPVAVTASHVLIDGFRSRLDDSARYFLLDQIIHVVLIVLFWGILVDFHPPDLWAWIATLWINPAFWIVLVVYLIIIWPVGYWIGKITAPWSREIGEDPSRGLKNAGLWIGRLERILILTFVLTNRYELIGFLIAAKSIFRFGEIRDPAHRKEAEYILIGTMISFAMAIVLGLIVNWVLGR